MKKIMFSISLIFLLHHFAMANEIGMVTARRVATNLYYEKTAVSPAAIVFGEVFTESVNGRAAFYVFNVVDNQGFVIISADNSVNPVLGYSTSGSFQPHNLPPALAFLLNSYKEQIAIVQNKKLSATTATLQQWQHYAQPAESFAPAKSATNIAPLLKTNWDQNAGWNNACPFDDTSHTGNHRVYAGCVATSMGQIMKYYRHPVKGIGSHTYNSTYGVLTANFDTTHYKWADMPNNSPTNTTAQLLFQLGVSVEMNYGSIVSTTEFDNTPINSFKQYFSYDENIRRINCAQHGTPSQGWVDTLKNELNQNRPILYCGANDSNLSHAWIVDGYEGNLFHCNWGWSGDKNGMFQLGSLIVFGHNLSYTQSAIIGIKPNASGTPVCDFNSNLKNVGINSAVSFFDQSSNMPTEWQWSFPGGNPSSSTLENPTVTYHSTGYYDVSLYTKNSSGTSDTVKKTKYIFVCQPILPANCIPHSTNLDTVIAGVLYNFGTGIYNVTFNTIDNTTKQAYEDNPDYGYMDFSNTVSTIVKSGQTYKISVTRGFFLKQNPKDINNPEYVKVFIDYNNNGSFDTDELVFSANSGVGAAIDYVLIPETAVRYTLLRMRVISSLIPINDACSAPRSGQAEDYGVSIIQGFPIGIADNIANTVLVNLYPNPNNGNFTLTGIKTATLATICTISGSVLQTVNLNDGTNTINVSSLASGIYILKLQTADGVVVKRFVKQ